MIGLRAEFVHNHQRVKRDRHLQDLEVLSCNAKCYTQFIFLAIMLHFDRKPFKARPGSKLFSSKLISTRRGLPSECGTEVPLQDVWILTNRRASIPLKGNEKTGFLVRAAAE
ncbi:hypothetical protein TNCV_931681 [Trichonephila clavipes]|uniref:Uncharacterized protein n=1 Tax=Trichonephila clavipes TaxID=2585209 RepID=A0A8X6W2U9_TRICX|nr:hypothetical protein TNCV_931681 [Trichonephila clavipes]